MHADISVRPTGNGTIKLDGHDISASVRGFVLNAAVGEVTQLELDLAMIEVTKLSAEVDVVIIPSATRELLERLGWTPPRVDE